MNPGEEIDSLIAEHPDWRGAKLASLRRTILEVDPEIVETRTDHFEQIDPCQRVLSVMLARRSATATRAAGVSAIRLIVVLQTGSAAQQGCRSLRPWRDYGTRAVEPGTALYANPA